MPRSSATADKWADLGNKFEALAKEEQALAGSRLNAYVPDYWELSCDVADFELDKAVPDKIRARFELLGTRAGLAFGHPPNGSSPLGYWLHRLYQHSWEQRSGLKKLQDRAKNGIELPDIEKVCEQSATFCQRLQKQALEGEAQSKSVAERFREWIEDNSSSVQPLFGSMKNSVRRWVSDVVNGARTSIPIDFLSARLNVYELPLPLTQCESLRAFLDQVAEAHGVGWCVTLHGLWMAQQPPLETTYIDWRGKQRDNAAPIDEERQSETRRSGNADAMADAPGAFQLTPEGHRNDGTLILRARLAFLDSPKALQECSTRINSKRNMQILAGGHISKLQYYRWAHERPVEEEARAEIARQKAKLQRQIKEAELRALNGSDGQGTPPVAATIRGGTDAQASNAIRTVTRAPIPPTPVRGGRSGWSHPPKRTRMPDFPARYPRELIVETERIVTEALQKFVTQRQAQGLCTAFVARITTETSALVRRRALPAESALFAIRGMVECLLRENCDDFSERMKIRDEIQRSSEWLSFLEELKESNDVKLDGATEPAQPLLKAGQQQEFHPSTDYCTIECGGNSYSLTPNAGAIVKNLHEAYQRGHGLSTKQLQRLVGCKKIWDQFRKRNGRVFFQQFIEKDEKDVFRLKLEPLPKGNDPR